MKIDLAQILKGALGVALVSLSSWVGTTLYENDTRISIIEYKVEQLLEAKKELQQRVMILENKSNNKKHKQSK